MTVAFGQRLDSRGKSPSFQSLSQNFRSHNTCSDGLTGTAANWLEPGYFSQGEKSVVILPNLQKRCILEGIAEKYELRLQAPELPVPSETQLGPAHRALVGQLQGFYRQRLADDKDRIWLEFTTAMAATLSLNESVGSQIEQDNLEELSDLLGKRPANLKAGLARLQDAIMDDHMSDLEPRLNFLYRMEVRRDYLFKPMQQATGVSPSTPLGRFDD